MKSTRKSVRHLAVMTLAAALPVYSNAARLEDAILTLTVENDSIAQTDRHYTHGSRISYLHRENHLPQWAGSLLETAPLGLNVSGRRIGIALGQNIYTPRDISVPRLMRNDRPYGGWIYAGLLLQRNGSEYAGHVGVWDSLEIDVGVVGSSSFADDTQTWWHKLWGLQEPLGWDHQLKNEPALLLQLSRSYNLATPHAGEGWGMDVTTTIGAAAGNVFTHGRGELIGRAGYRLTPGFATATQGTIHPSVLPRIPAAVDPPSLPPWGAFAFAGIEGRAVARNIFLEGNTWRDSHSVEKEYFVADLKAGVSFHVGSVQLTGTYVYRTREFRLQPSPNQFGSLSLAFRF